MVRVRDFNTRSMSYRSGHFIAISEFPESAQRDEILTQILGEINFKFLHM